MKEFRTKKLSDAILVQSRLSKDDAKNLAQSLEKDTNWEKEFNYQSIVGKKLKSLGLLRSQNAKSCKIRKGTQVK